MHNTPRYSSARQESVGLSPLPAFSGFAASCLSPARWLIGLCFFWVLGFPSFLPFGLFCVLVCFGVASLFVFSFPIGVVL
jgi:hypothetical protein